MAPAPSPFDRPLPSTPPVAPLPQPRPPTSGASGAPSDAQAERLARLAAARAGTGGGSGKGSSGRKSHPSKTARTVALVSSLLATGGVAAAMTVADAPPQAGTIEAAGEVVPASDNGSGAAAAATAADAGTPATTSTTRATAAATTPTTTATTSRAAASTTAKYADGTYTGAAEWTRWGYVQVQATVKNGKLTDVAALQSPGDGKSRSINARAQPVLEREAVAVQGADIDIVSGATYTSRTYAASLQAALDQAARKVATAKTGQS